MFEVLRDPALYEFTSGAPPVDVDALARLYEHWGKRVSPIHLIEERRLMHKLTIALAAAVLAAAPSAAQSQEADVMVPVHKFVDGFNKGDTETAVAACADQTSIIDEFPPHEWHGAGACSQWMKDYDSYAKANGITDGVVTLNDPRHVDITADRAYVVIPSDYNFKLEGEPAKETGSLFTFVLHKGAAGWRITGWSWAKN
jgi:hypothetical protein